MQTNVINRYIKNLVIGSNRLKGSIIELGVVPRLIQLMDHNNEELRRETVLTIASLAKGTDDHLKIIIESGVVPILLANTRSSNSHYVEACLRCLRTIFKSSQAPINVLYTENNNNDESSLPIIPHLLSLAAYNQPFINKECVANIMASACQVSDSFNYNQLILY